jgi:hypothetical protein
MRPVTPRLNKTHVAIGVAVSLMVHLLAAVWAWQHKTPAPHFAEKTAIAVHLLPPPKPAELPPPPPLFEPAKPNKETAKRSVHGASHATPPAIFATPTRVENDQPQVPAPAVPQEKHLDMNAIYGSVKSTMTQIDRENAETPLGQVAAKPLYPPENGNKIGKMIDKTTRADCKDQVEGAGLLTPLLAVATLFDKKDNGCKWR